MSLEIFSGFQPGAFLKIRNFIKMHYEHLDGDFQISHVTKNMLMAQVRVAQCFYVVTHLETQEYFKQQIYQKSLQKLILYTILFI